MVLLSEGILVVQRILHTLGCPLCPLYLRDWRLPDDGGPLAPSVDPLGAGLSPARNAPVLLSRRLPVLLPERSGCGALRLRRLRVKLSPDAGECSSGSRRRRAP